MIVKARGHGSVRMCLNVAAGAAFLLSATNMCLAAQSTRAREAHACEKDAFKFCGADIPNKKRIAACLQARREELRPACRAMFPASDGQPARDMPPPHGTL